jgi:hypothetical protein
MLVFNASVSKKKILRTYLDVINGFLGLTERERDVLTILFELDLYWDSEKPINIIDMHSRRYMMQNTYINKNNLSKYISKFKDKQILEEYDENKWRINRKIFPSTLLTNNSIKIDINIKQDV